jgi:hypothetical protein
MWRRWKKKGKDIKRIRGDYKCEDHREKKMKRKEKILFISRTRDTCIELYKLSRVKWVLKISIHTWPVRYIYYVFWSLLSVIFILFNFDELNWVR